MILQVPRFTQVWAVLQFLKTCEHGLQFPICLKQPVCQNKERKKEKELYIKPKCFLANRKGNKRKKNETHRSRETGFTTTAARSEKGATKNHAIGRAQEQEHRNMSCKAAMQNSVNYARGVATLNLFILLHARPYKNHQVFKFRNQETCRFWCECRRGTLLWHLSILATYDWMAQ